MMRINVTEARARLSYYLRRVAEGEVVILCKRGVPIARIQRLPRRPRRRRPIGLARGEFEVPESFFAPLPGGILRAFEGDGETEED